jgi:hypothetical protein
MANRYLRRNKGKRRLREKSSLSLFFIFFLVALLGIPW